MKTLHVLTDVYGPRLTGSPNLKQAGEWAAQQIDVVGTGERAAGALELRPSGLAERALHRAHHLAREGRARRRGAGVDALDQPASCARRDADLSRRSALPRESLTAYLRQRRRRVKGRAVLVGSPEGRRRDLQSAGEAAGRGRGARPVRCRSTRRRRRSPNQRRPTPRPGGSRQPGERAAWIGSSSTQRRGASGVNDAGREHGQIRAFNNRTFDVAKAVPTIVLRNEDFGRISRLLADGTTVRARGRDREPRVSRRARRRTTPSARSRAPTRPTRS